MQSIWKLTRRRFLSILSAAGVIAPSEPLRAVARSSPVPAAGFRTLEPGEIATLEAIVEQIIPADKDPGAKEAGVIHYIDRILAGEQREKRHLYRAAIAATNVTSVALFGKAFHRLVFDQQTAVLKAIERGDQGEHWNQIPSSQFFAMIWTHTLEGFYGPPSHGGNKKHASWKMIGYPIEH